MVLARPVQNVPSVTMLFAVLLTILPRPLVMTDVQPATSVATQVQYGMVGRMDVFTIDALAQATIEDRVKLQLRAPTSYGRLGERQWGGLGNVSGGAFALHRRENLRFGAGATLWLPTAADDAAVAQVMRIAHEPGEFVPGATTLRIEGLVRAEAGPAFGQLAVGFMEMWMRSGPDYDAEFSRFAAAVGIAAGGGWSVVAEWTSTGLFQEPDRPGLDYIHAFDWGLRWDAPSVSVVGGVMVPLEHLINRDFRLGMGGGVTWTI
jgi:hypothetical protein